MSLDTWKKKYYPTPARRVSEEDAIAHSLRKWRGLRPAALARHGVRKLYDRIKDEDEDLEIDGSSCALCVHYYRDRDCHDCPLMQALGHPCDRDASPYHQWTDGNDPEPMIAGLQKAQLQVRRKATR